MRSDESDSDAMDTFKKRLFRDWLPAYCNDLNRQYSLEGFVEDSISALSPVDARDFMRALDRQLLVCDDGGRFTAPLSKATEVIFWEHERNTVPRKITLWLEPVITIACVARLHLDFGWPLEMIGMQSDGYAFDVATYPSGCLDQMMIAGEVKKTTKELNSLISKLSLCCAEGEHDHCLNLGSRKNAHKKWVGLNRFRGSIFWAVGPGADNRVFRVIFRDEHAVALEPAALTDLQFHS